MALGGGDYGKENAAEDLTLLGLDLHHPLSRRKVRLVRKSAVVAGDFETNEVHLCPTRSLSVPAPAVLHWNADPTRREDRAVTENRLTRGQIKRIVPILPEAIQGGG